VGPALPGALDCERGEEHDSESIIVSYIMLSSSVCAVSLRDDKIYHISEICA